MARVRSASPIWKMWWRTSSRCERHRPRRKKERLVRISNGFLLATCLAAWSPVSGQVTSERLVNASQEPQQWLTYSGSYNGQRFSPLDQVNRGNVQRLAL